MPVIWGGMNGRLGEVKFNSLSVLLYSGASSSIVLIKISKNAKNDLVGTLIRS